MFDGKTKCALDMLSGERKGGLLHLSDVVNVEENTTVRDVLESKHPAAAPPYPECLDAAFDSSLVYHPIIFDALDGSVIRAAALRTSGSAGPSGVDAYGWRRLCIAFKSAASAVPSPSWLVGYVLHLLILKLSCHLCHVDLLLWIKTLVFAPLVLERW